METKINLLYRGLGSSVVRRRKFEAKGRGYEPQLNQNKFFENIKITSYRLHRIPVNSKYQLS